MQLQRRPSGLPDWLHIAILAALGLYFVIGAIARATFIYKGIPVPDSFAMILATIAGAAYWRRLLARLGPLNPCPKGGQRHRPSDSRRWTRRSVLGP